MSNFCNALSKRIVSFVFAFSTLLIISCGGGSGGGGGGNPPPAGGTGGPTTNVTVSWTANKDGKVNRAGGGYKIYASLNSGFNITDQSVVSVTVANNGGNTATATQIPLVSGKQYIRVVAFGLIAGSTYSSAASSEISIVVPAL